MLSINYVVAAVKNVKEKLAKEGRKLPMKALTPMNITFIPELDNSNELDPQQMQYY